MNGKAWQTAGDDGLPQGLLTAIRHAQDGWARTGVSRRVRVAAGLRSRMVSSAESLAEACAAVRGVDAAEVYSSEILPLADACRFLKRDAAQVLKPRKLGWRGRPAWLWGVNAEVVREPFGLVLILAPSNYPLFLAGAQALQALTAGNAVLVKPAPGCDAPLHALARLLMEAGLPEHLCTVLPADPEPVARWIRHAAGLVVLTGGADTGRAVMKACAESLVPCIMELSGLDSLHVLADANLDRVVEAIQFGLRLNRGKTCIAPRRILAQREAAGGLRERLDKISRAHPGPRVTLPAETCAEIQRALEAGAVIRCGRWDEKEGAVSAPLVLEGVPRESSLWHTDHFAPVALFAEVAGTEEALRLDEACPFALGASVFGRDLRAAQDFARRLPAGVVTLNDLIAPTADPRLPFGGCRRSGFGVTRGPEGLLSLTRPKAIVRRPADAWAPHFEPAAADRDRWLLHALHGKGWRARATAFLRLAAARQSTRASHGPGTP